MEYILKSTGRAKSGQPAYYVTPDCWVTDPLDAGRFCTLAALLYALQLDTAKVTMPVDATLTVCTLERAVTVREL